MVGGLEQASGKDGVGRERRSFHFLERKARLPTAKLVAGLAVPQGQERALGWRVVGRDEAPSSVSF